MKGNDKFIPCIEIVSCLLNGSYLNCISEFVRIKWKSNPDSDYIVNLKRFHADSEDTYLLCK